MLKEFSVKNFRSINDEITLSLEADTERVSEYKNHIININDNKILKIASMYGPNGGGKTNIISALTILKNLVIMNRANPITLEDDISCVFCDDKEINETIFFVTDKYEVGYNVSFVHGISNDMSMNIFGIPNGMNTIIFKIKNEMVSYREKGESNFKTLFERDKKGEIKSDYLNDINYSETINENLTALNYLFNTFVNKVNIKNKALDVIDTLYDEINSIYFLDSNRVNMSVAINTILNNKDRILKFLNDVDIKIKDIIINKNDKNNPIKFEREVIINDKKISKVLPLVDESSGTKKVFWLFLNLIGNNRKNTIYISDDMNAFLHPKLYRAIIEYFGSDKNKYNQLVFNSHDIINMNNELFRRDEIWFVYRDDNYSTKLVPLSNIVNYKGEQIRKDAKYNKQYLEGKYGADPFIKKGLSWNE